MGPNERRDNRAYTAIGRLKLTATIAGAQSQMDTINARLQQEYPETNAGWSVRLNDLQAWTTRDVRTSLLLLLGAVGLVLLIARISRTCSSHARRDGGRNRGTHRTRNWSQKSGKQRLGVIKP